MKHTIINFFSKLAIVAIFVFQGCMHIENETFGKHCGNESCPHPIAGDCKCYRGNEEKPEIKIQKRRSPKKESNFPKTENNPTKQEGNQQSGNGPIGQPTPNQKRQNEIPEHEKNSRPGNFNNTGERNELAFGVAEKIFRGEGKELVGDIGEMLECTAKWMFLGGYSSGEEREEEENKLEQKKFENYKANFEKEQNELNEKEKRDIEEHKKQKQFAEECIRSVAEQSVRFDTSYKELISEMEESRKNLDLERENDEKAYEASVIAMDKETARMEAITASLPKLDQIFIPSARQFDVNDIQEDLEYLQEDLAELEDRSTIPSNLQSKIESIFQNIKKQKTEILPLYLNLKDGINPKLYHEENRESDKNTAKNLLDKVDTFKKETLNLLKSFNQDPAKYGYKPKIDKPSPKKKGRTEKKEKIESKPIPKKISKVYAEDKARLQEELATGQEKKKSKKANHRAFIKLYQTDPLKYSTEPYRSYMEAAKKDFLESREQCQKICELLGEEYYSSGHEDDVLSSTERANNEEFHKSIGTGIKLSGIFIESAAETFINNLDSVALTFLMANAPPVVQGTVAAVSISRGLFSIPEIVDKIENYYEEFQHLSSEQKAKDFGAIFAEFYTIFRANKNLPKADLSSTITSEVGLAMEKEYRLLIKNLKDVKIINDGLLKKYKIDAHALKYDILGQKAPIDLYDLYKHTKTKEILIFRKGGRGEAIPTGKFIE